MLGRTTYAQKLGMGFAIMLILTIVIGVVANVALREVVTTKDEVIDGNARILINVQRLLVLHERHVAGLRGYLLNRDASLQEQVNATSLEFATLVDQLKRATMADENRQLLERIEDAERAYNEVATRAIELRKTESSLDVLARFQNDEIKPRRDQLAKSLEAFRTLGERSLEEARQASSDRAGNARQLVNAVALAAIAFTGFVAFFLSRTIARQLGSAIGQVQNSSVELQSAANQQATGAKEQATAMTEVTTTINELLATSRQIAESARRVVQIADQTRSAATSGTGSVDVANESILAIRRQTEMIVSHMLELGRKSQQIGGILDILSELAEQTNILAINATIEAAGAGDTGKRFSVVADEIRKLADRVASSTKDVRTLIGDVQSAVNTTVMATESGAKAVDSGSKQFTDVATSFKHIASMVVTTTEAAREIELSTKQQATAVEQVNIAISNVAQASKETELTTGQTLQTASELASLSRNLLKLVQANAA